MCAHTHACPPWWPPERCARVSPQSDHPCAHASPAQLTAPSCTAAPRPRSSSRRCPPAPAEPPTLLPTVLRPGCGSWVPEPQTAGAGNVTAGARAWGCPRAVLLRKASGAALFPWQCPWGAGQPRGAGCRIFQRRGVRFSWASAGVGVTRLPCGVSQVPRVSRVSSCLFPAGSHSQSLARAATKVPPRVPGPRSGVRPRRCRSCMAAR